jgi:hypothetical protein
MSDALKLDKLLTEEGYDTDEAREAARAVLVDEKLTRPGKEGISSEKRGAVREALAAHLFKTCGHPDCDAMSAEAGRAGQTLVRVTTSSCPVCSGSNNRRAALATARCLLAKDVRRVLVVGGTPTLHGEIQQLFAGLGLTFQCLDGAEGTYTAKDAANHLRWAQVAVVWGSTPLPHKVSKLYTDAPPAHVRVIQLSRRGIESLCQELRKSYA